MRIAFVTLLCILGLTAFVTTGTRAGDKADVEKELKKFQGTWTFESVQAGGKEDAAAEFKGFMVTFTGDRYTVKKGDEVIQVGVQKLDPSKSPKAVDVMVTEGLNKGAVMLGIYEIGSDTLKVCFDSEGKKRPAEFKSAAGSQTFVNVHKRVMKPAPVKEPELRSELLGRTKADQEARKAIMQWMKDHGPDSGTAADASKELKAEYEKLRAKVTALDTDNTKWLQGVVDRHGWPSITLVGKDGANAAWLLVQHADADPKFQRRCLDLMAKLPKDEVSQLNLAYLTDRVLLAEGKKQVYGTQFIFVDGKWRPRPLEDEANVDKRRAEVGLQPLAEYAKLIEKQSGGSPKK
jgi:uncharacterized protein (TIGR03067 family)